MQTSFIIMILEWSPDRQLLAANLAKVDVNFGWSARGVASNARDLHQLGRNRLERADAYRTIVASPGIADAVQRLFSFRPFVRGIAFRH